MSNRTFDYLNQGKVWFARDGRCVNVIDMDPEWRFNASRMMERRADQLAAAYGWGELDWMLRIGHIGENAADALDEGMARRDNDPVTWIRSTTLYRALVVGLPTKRKKLRRLAERARHFSDCPGRSGAVICTCDRIAKVMSQQADG